MQHEASCHGGQSENCTRTLERQTRLRLQTSGRLLPCHGLICSDVHQGEETILHTHPACTHMTPIVLRSFLGQRHSISLYMIGQVRQTGIQGMNQESLEKQVSGICPWLFACSTLETRLWGRHRRQAGLLPWSCYCFGSRIGNHSARSSRQVLPCGQLGCCRCTTSPARAHIRRLPSSKASLRLRHWARSSAEWHPLGVGQNGWGSSLSSWCCGSTAGHAEAARPGLEAGKASLLAISIGLQL